MPYPTMKARRLLVLALSLSGACGGPPPDDAAANGALGEQNVGQDCSAVLPWCDFNGAYPYQSKTADGTCICRATPCSVDGVMLDQAGKAHPELNIVFSSTLDSSYIASDSNGYFHFDNVDCTDNTWLTVRSPDNLFELFPGAGQPRLAADSRLNPTDVAITVHLESLDNAPTGPCDNNGLIVDDNQCTQVPGDPSMGLRCTDNQLRPDPVCAKSQCTWDNGMGTQTYWEGDCDYDASGQAYECQHNTSMKRVDACP
jgi:hypothetical protein